MKMETDFTLAKGANKKAIFHPGQELTFGFPLLRDSQLTESNTYELKVDQSPVVRKLLATLTDYSYNKDNASRDFDRWAANQLESLRQREKLSQTSIGELGTLMRGPEFFPALEDKNKEQQRPVDPFCESHAERARPFSEEGVGESGVGSEGHSERKRTHDLSTVSIFSKRSENSTNPWHNRTNRPLTMADLDENESGGRSRLFKRTSQANTVIETEPSARLSDKSAITLPGRSSEPREKSIFCNSEFDESEQENQPQKGAQPSGPGNIQNRLLAKGEEYFLRKLAKTRSQVLEEMKECTFRPNINHFSRSGAHDPTAKFSQTLQAGPLRPIENGKEPRQPSFTPTINPRSRDLAARKDASSTRRAKPAPEVQPPRPAALEASNLLIKRRISEAFSETLRAHGLPSNPEQADCSLSPDQAYEIVRAMGFLGPKERKEDQALARILIKTLESEDSTRVSSQSLLIFLLGIFGVLAEELFAAQPDSVLTLDDLAMVQQSFFSLKANYFCSLKAAKRSVLTPRSTTPRASRPSLAAMHSKKVLCEAADLIARGQLPPPSKNEFSKEDLWSLGHTVSQAKITSKRRQMEDRELKECTFHPLINRGPRTPRASLTPAPAAAPAEKRAQPSLKASWIKLDVQLSDSVVEQILFNIKQPFEGQRQVEALVQRHGLAPDKAAKLRQLVERQTLEFKI